MTPRPIRLQPGVDLRRELERLLDNAEIAQGFVIAGIGSISGAVIRFANDEAETTMTGPHEVLTLSGSLSANGAHLHITVSSQSGAVVGGHAGYGNTVRTTAEILLVETPDWNLSRVNDDATGYKELLVQPAVAKPGEA
jgi:uncharacterized protein